MAVGGPVFLAAAGTPAIGPVYPGTIPGRSLLAAFDTPTTGCVYRGNTSGGSVFFIVAGTPTVNTIFRASCIVHYARMLTGLPDRLNQ